MTGFERVRRKLLGQLPQWSEEEITSALLKLSLEISLGVEGLGAEHMDCEKFKMRLIFYCGTCLPLYRPMIAHHVHWNNEIVICGGPEGSSYPVLPRWPIAALCLPE